MKRLTLLIFSACFMLTNTNSQTIKLKFSAMNSDEWEWVQLDSIKVMNLTQGGDTVLYYPDTVLILNMVGIAETGKINGGLRLFQNYPNPVKNQSTITLQVPSPGMVKIKITDLMGRQLINTEQMLESGFHSFSLTPGDDDVYFLTARWKLESRSIKILCSPAGSHRSVALEYAGPGDTKAELKATKAIQNFLFNPGDELLYVGYTDTFESGILDAPEESETYPFEFATNIPCPGTPTVTYDGQVYNTIQIFSQCWLKENLNVGTMIPGASAMTDNDTIEKYCYDNEPDSCTKYGGLYQWDEMMQYTTQQGTQGICPPGWHLPTDEEWKVLEGGVDSHYGIGDPEWDIWDYRGFDADANLKTTSGWYDNSNGTDLFGFSALPGGYRHVNVYFHSLGGYGTWWSATEANDTSAWSRSLHYNYDGVRRTNYNNDYGFSVRCLRD